LDLRSWISEVGSQKLDLRSKSEIQDGKSEI
jgi:hypothetical protein